MEIEDAIVAYLKTKTGLTALITHQRKNAAGAMENYVAIFADEAPQGTPFPYVTYIDISDVKNHTHDGQLANENPVKQFTVHAASKASSKAVATQLKAALCDYTGMLSGLEVEYITMINEFASKDKTPDMSVNYVDLEFEIAYIRG